MAGGYHHDKTYNYYNETTEVNYMDSDVSKGVAMALAAFHPFDYATKKWQTSANNSDYYNENATSIAAAKRFDAMDALWYGSYTRSWNGGKPAYTFGAMWRF
jgi:hypothetical protein